MKINDILDLSLRQILEDYVIINNLECGYYYGIAPSELVERLFNEYNVEKDYPEAFNVENVVNDEILVSYDEDIISYEKMEKIMANLGISKKE